MWPQTFGRSGAHIAYDLNRFLNQQLTDYQDIKFVKVNVQAEADIAARYGIRGISVIKFFCEGKEVGEIVGFVPENALKKRIEEISKNAPSCLSNTSIRR